MTKQRTITTKKGDNGYTGLLSGERVPKDSLRVDICGDIDELTSVLGVARCCVKDKKVKDRILAIQQTLFICAAEISTTPNKRVRLKRRIDEISVNKLEAQREQLERKLKISNVFIVPGSNPASAAIDHARTVARRCERKTVKLLKSEQKKNKFLIIWMNRLSDYLYLLARSEEQ